MKAAPKKVILRYKQEDIEATQKNKRGTLWINTTENPNQHCCEVAYIEGDNEQLNKDGFHNGDKLLVQYLVYLDEASQRGYVEKNQFFIESQNGDQLRWCYWDQIFGKQNKDGTFTPVKGFVFCELPEKVEVKSKLWTPQQKQDTDNKGYFTTIKYIHPVDAEESGLKSGDRVVCEQNTDAVKNTFGEELIRVPFNRILGKVEN
jgi:hypothetical protein